MGGHSKDRFHPSAAGPVQSQRERDRPVPGLEAGVAERAGVGYADAELLHQSRGAEFDVATSRRTEEGQIIALRHHREKKERQDWFWRRAEEAKARNKKN